MTLFQRLSFSSFSRFAWAGYLAAIGNLAAQAEKGPLSDPSNQGGWVLHAGLSDEFESGELDTSKWALQFGTGVEGTEGDASPGAAIPCWHLDAGKLKFNPHAPEPGPNDGISFPGSIVSERSPTALISRERFLYGYLEIKSKRDPASLVKVFSTLGFQSQFEVIKRFGPSPRGDETGRASLGLRIEDRRATVVPDDRLLFSHQEPLSASTDGAFHVYGLEWGVGYFKIYLDGKQLYEGRQEELGDAWLMTNPVAVCLPGGTSQSSPPIAADGSAGGVEVEYVRVWQKPDGNLLDPALHGFEGPLVKDRGPSLSGAASALRFWEICETSQTHFAITAEKSATGRKSLRFSHDGQLDNGTRADANGPFGSIDIPGGDYELSLKLWLEPDACVDRLRIILEQPWVQPSPVELTDLPSGKWITVTKRLTRDGPSGPRDRLRFMVSQFDCRAGQCTLYVDDVALKPVH